MPSMDRLTDLVLNSGPFPYRVVNRRVARFDVYIGRPSKWGNPFLIGRDGNRAMVIEKYRRWILTQPELIATARAELKDKVLGCWCHPKPCHGDILMAIANRPA